MLLVDLSRTLKRFEYWIYCTWFEFLVRYRTTVFGPLLLLVGPGLFIASLGVLFSYVNDIDPALFIPHLAIGLIVWTLISGFVTGGTTLSKRKRPQILQGGLNLTDLVMSEIATTVFRFTHQAVLIIIIFWILKRSITPYAVVSLVGLMLLIANGIWLGIVFGILGARFRDLNELVQAMMRIAFLATPIIWLPSGTGRGSVLNVFLTFNPFYHFLHLIRAPLMNTPINSESWKVVLAITLFGFVLAHYSYQRYSRQIALWT